VNRRIAGVHGPPRPEHYPIVVDGRGRGRLVIFPPPPVGEPFHNYFFPDDEWWPLWVPTEYEET